MQIGPGVIIGGKFRIEGPLSRGGMGSVWVARHVHLGHPVAVKLMDAAFAASPEFRARFEREARAAANLQTPHVVQVQDYGIDHGAPYLVMELLRGEDLSARLRRCGRLSLGEAARLLSQAGKAIRRAHEAGLVHRDLKPGNIFLAQVEDDEVVKVLDFGIAKQTGAQISGEATKTGQVLGSPYYMSPEQIRGDRDLDARSDLWSLGVILFRMLTGELPFPGDQLGAVMAKILVDPMPVATQMAPDLPPAIDGFFARALARDRAQRFQSVREMLDELARLAGAAQPVTAMAPWANQRQVSSPAIIAAAPPLPQPQPPASAFAAAPQPAGQRQPSSPEFPAVAQPVAPPPRPADASLQPSAAPASSPGLDAPAPPQLGDLKRTLRLSADEQDPRAPVDAPRTREASQSSQEPQREAPAAGAAVPTQPLGLKRTSPLPLDDARDHGPLAAGDAGAHAVGPGSGGALGVEAGHATIGTLTNASTIDGGRRATRRKPFWPLVIGSVVIVLVAGAATAALRLRRTQDEPTAAGPELGVVSSAPSATGEPAGTAILDTTTAPAVTASATAATEPPVPATTTTTAPATPPVVTAPARQGVPSAPARSASTPTPAPKAHSSATTARPPPKDKDWGL